VREHVRAVFLFDRDATVLAGNESDEFGIRVGEAIENRFNRLRQLPAEEQLQERVEPERDDRQRGAAIEHDIHRTWHDVLEAGHVENEIRFDWRRTTMASTCLEHP